MVAIFDLSKLLNGDSSTLIWISFYGGVKHEYSEYKTASNKPMSTPICW